MLVSPTEWKAWMKMMNQTALDEATDSAWKRLYEVGRAAALIARRLFQPGSSVLEKEAR